MNLMVNILYIMLSISVTADKNGKVYDSQINHLLHYNYGSLSTKKMPSHRYKNSHYKPETVW